MCMNKFMSLGKLSHSLDHFECVMALLLRVEGCHVVIVVGERVRSCIATLDYVSRGQSEVARCCNGRSEKKKCDLFLLESYVHFLFYYRFTNRFKTIC